MQVSLHPKPAIHPALPHKNVVGGAAGRAISFVMREPLPTMCAKRPIIQMDIDRLKSVDSSVSGSLNLSLPISVASPDAMPPSTHQRPVQHQTKAQGDAMRSKNRGIDAAEFLPQPREVGCLGKKLPLLWFNPNDRHLGPAFVRVELWPRKPRRPIMALPPQPLEIDLQPVPFGIARQRRPHFCCGPEPRRCDIEAHSEHAQVANRIVSRPTRAHCLF